MSDLPPVDPDLVGLIPAAGRAARLGELPGSKEVLPVGPPGPGSEGRPHGAPRAPDSGRRLVCEPLLEALRRAGVGRALWILRAGKWDIPAALGDGARWGLDLAYLTLAASGSVPETLDRARGWVRGATVVLGYPDILFGPPDAVARLVAAYRAGGTPAMDVLLGLVPTDRPSKADMVDLDEAGRIRGILVKPPASTLRYTWIFAVWGPAFTGFLHRALPRLPRPAGRELYPSDVLLAAMAANKEGMRVEALPFPEGHHLDVGTPDDLARAAALYGSG
jgi:glucose-1-phosphate thymidylyltransferase